MGGDLVYRRSPGETVFRLTLPLAGGGESIQSGG